VVKIRKANDNISVLKKKFDFLNYSKTDFLVFVKRQLIDGFEYNINFEAAFQALNGCVIAFYDVTLFCTMVLQERRK